METVGEGNLKIALGLAAATVIALAGCQTMPPQEPMIWIRTDGKPIKGIPANEQKAKIDALACQGEAAKIAGAAPPVYYSGLAGAISAAQVMNERGEAIKAVAIGCMADRGYLYVKESDAPPKLRGKPLK